MGNGRRVTDSEKCGEHEARITNLETWIARIDARFWAIIIGVAMTFGSSLISIMMVYFRRP